MPYLERTVVIRPVKVNPYVDVATAYVSHCGANNKGYTVEILTGSPQTIANAIRDRRLSYGNVEIINMTSYEIEKLYAIITYIIR